MDAIGRLFDLHNIYEHTTVILGTESLMMGATFLALRNILKNNSLHAKSGLLFLAIAMFVLGIVNCIEYTIGADIQRELDSLAAVLFSASLEMFLLFMAYMSMLYKEFVTQRRIYFELGCIVLFTTPIMFVSTTDSPLLFNVLFTIGTIFYGVKLACNFFEYRKQIKKTRAEIENFLSDDSNVWLKWVNNTFNIIVAIGVISIIAPMTNLTMLAFYNVFLIIAFFYIYISVIHNIYIFNKSMTMLESEDVDSSWGVETPAKPMADFMVARHKLLANWIANRGYAVAGVTATEVATQLKSNRTRLSYYLKHHLNTSYYEWIAELRIEDAKRQLTEHPDRAIYEIAINVGIEDRDNFRRAFQRYTGVSPTTYRKEHR